MKLARRTKRNKRCAGMTLLEIMVAVGIMGMVFIAVAFIESTTARQTLALYGDARTLHRAQLILEYIRYKVCTAQVDSLVVKDSGGTLEYLDPNMNGATSLITLVDGKVHFYEDKTKTPTTPLQGIGKINNLQFVILGAGHGVQVTVQTLQKYSWKLDRPYTLTAEITMRN
jgi:Tfp pilus assembly protein PilV